MNEHKSCRVSQKSELIFPVLLSEMASIYVFFIICSDLHLYAVVLD